ncbi:hypothetical protein ACFSO0_04700 [Brevibacillus sp. GCM10020057]|uniref:hypothetical protein n=1 Tax=Brevibacillus sp. GCM10020057 TaxID=3317327 RepID=UPI00362D7679
MLQYMVEQLNEHLSAYGTILDVTLRSDQSLVEEAEVREVILTFADEETEGKPLATIHLFELEGSCEVEVEVQFTGREDGGSLWLQAQAVVPEVAMTEKRRYVQPGQSAQSEVVLDYHFLAEQPQSEEEAQTLTRTLERFAADLGKLVRLS